MEWVETTARTIDEARELALDQLGVTADEAEFEIVEEPRPGLFGRLRGEARVRARVRPTTVRPKQQRRGRDTSRDAGRVDASPAGEGRDAGGRRSSGRRPRRPEGDGSVDEPAGDGPAPVRDDRPPVSVEEVRAAADEFMTGLVDAFGYDAKVSSNVADDQIDVSVSGSSLGLLIGPGGRTLLAIQDLARVAAQRRLGDHLTRLRVDAAGYREKRRQALERFAATVAEHVVSSGVARSLDPMPSADRKVVHDALAGVDGVVSHSEGEDPYRRIVVSPAPSSVETASA